MISFVRAQMARTNTHELDARMNFKIYGSMPNNQLITYVNKPIVVRFR